MNLAEAFHRRSGGRRRASAVSDRDYFQLIGGLNTEDPPLKVSPGECLAALNYEPWVRGGYQRIGGFERFDGRPAPSVASYLVVEWDGGTLANYPAVGDTVTDDTSGATGVVLAVFASYSGGFSASPADTDDNTIGFVVLGKVSGTFADNNNLSESTNVFGVVKGTPVGLAYDGADDVDWQLLAAALVRTDIAVVPGSGVIRGVWLFDGKVYAFRDNAGATACVMHQSTSSGWSAVTLGVKVRFDAGATEIEEGQTLTGASSTASATVMRVGVKSGTWAGGNAAGFVILGTVTNGPFTNNENLQVGGATVAVADGDSFTQTLSAGGRYEFRNNNFFGHADRRRMYGVNGLDPCFEYDADEGVFCQIDTGMTNDAPIHIAAHLDKLCLVFAGGSVQLSGTGKPHDWQVVLGAGELAVGGTCTGLLEEVGQAGNQALFVFTQDATYVLVGNTPATFQLLRYAIETGASQWTIQRIANGVYLDSRGFTTLSAAERFGNFVANSISQRIQTTLNGLRLQAIDSHISRTYNLYRCAFSNGTILSIGFDNQGRATGILPINLGKVMRCSCSEEDTNGAERTFFGSDDGYIYELDKGRTFDGADIEAFLRLQFHHSGNPGRIKRYRRAQVDIRTQGKTTLQGSVDFSYGDPDINFQPGADIALSGGGGFWDVNEWETFNWDSTPVANAVFKLEGSGYNLSILMYHKQGDELPHTLSGVALHHSQRRLDRSTNIS